MKTPTRNLHRQRGIGFFLLIFIFAVCAAVLLLGMKLFPVYNQYFNVKSVMASMANSDDVKSGTVTEIRNSFNRRAAIAYIDIITGNDLEITKDAGETVVTAAWQQKVPLFTGYALLIDLSVSTADK